MTLVRYKLYLPLPTQHTALELVGYLQNNFHEFSNVCFLLRRLLMCNYCKKFFLMTSNSEKKFSHYLFTDTLL